MLYADEREMNCNSWKYLGHARILAGAGIRDDRLMNKSYPLQTNNYSLLWNNALMHLKL